MYETGALENSTQPLTGKSSEHDLLVAGCAGYLGNRHLGLLGGSGCLLRSFCTASLRICPSTRLVMRLHSVLHVLHRGD
ncbi:hypothetical protein TcBrA4_0015920 [Trypanosoma cruzi]|nr:hypothetical protein TcBrA4_0015920 [Trypanosoma cruzi]